MSVLVNGTEGWICPKCGRALSPTITACPYCGEENADSSKPSFEDLNADPNKGLNALNS